MRFSIDTEISDIIQAPIIGNVYNVRGGSGARQGYMMVIIAIHNDIVTVLTINKDGYIRGGTSYGFHYFEDKCPIAYCDSLDQLTFKIGRI